MTFREWIAAKRPKTLGVALGVEHTTIRAWSSRNVIPRTAWPQIMIRYPEVGLRDLMEMEDDSKQGAQA